MNVISDFLIFLAEGFSGIFDAAGANFMGLVTGIIPKLVVLLTFVNALVAIIGEEKVDKFAKVCSKNIVLRYTVLPVLSMFFLTNPMAYTFGRFLKEKEKPAFYDAAVSFAHPITGLFPHGNPGETFVWLGIAGGIEALGQSSTPLALRYFLVGIIVIFMRGVITEIITKAMWKKEEA